ncbi:hypothetical protein [Streptomyces sp. NBC_01262]|uniref:hypothetical protein n=1 Tax=Streptomyces sp. NBC_01262 TaxID=2903803 RepID=UPI002E35F07A|nr:hypothetical protein [Streptomyces sp. NBC_01262]
MIDNTTRRFKEDPAEPLLLLAAGLGPGGTDQFIGEQEAAGQRQLVNSDRLPTSLRSPREEFEALGFTFGDPDPGDPMFCPATLPEGWSRQASDHNMWSYIVDTLGRRRVSIFYKAAFYDRSSFMRLDTVSVYVTDRVYHGQPIVTDEVWATHQAVAAELRNAADRAQKSLAGWEFIAQRDGASEMSTEYIAQDTAERDKYLAIAAEYDPQP